MRVTQFRRRFINTSLALALLCSIANADEQIAAVQKALKEQDFFFGEVNGERDEETRAAVRRFQIHSGLRVTGEIDEATVQAVQSKGGVEEAAPVAERSVRDRMRNVVRSDEEFLKEVEANEDSPATETAPPPTPVRPIAPPEPEETIATPPPAERVPSPAPERREARRTEQIPPPPPVREADESRPPGSSRITDREAEDFVRGYLQAAEAATPEREVSHYADRVDYFDSGRVNRRFIEKDQRNYYRRWPKRDFDLLETSVVKAGEKSATVRFRTKYDLGGGKERASGRIENVVRLTRGSDGEWKIASIRERKLGD